MLYINASNFICWVEMNLTFHTLKTAFIYINTKITTTICDSCMFKSVKNYVLYSLVSGGAQSA